MQEEEREFVVLLPFVGEKDRRVRLNNGIHNTPLPKGEGYILQQQGLETNLEINGCLELVGIYRFDGKAEASGQAHHLCIVF